MKISIPLLALAAGAAGWAGANAAPETPWAPSPHSETRLVAGLDAVPAGAATIVMGWQVRLDPGWKTYWRSPGDAGKAPVFSWEGSINVASVSLRYPFPERFEIFGLHTYGYHGEVTYPLEVVPLVAGAPMTLKAKVDFLVCETLCVPVEQSYELSLPAGRGAGPTRHFALLTAALAKVPKTGPLNAELEVAEVRIYGGNDARNAWLRIRGENLLSGADVILEDSETLRFGIPAKALGADPREAIFVVPVKGPGAGAALPQTVTVVVSDGWGNALEKRIDMDFNQANGKDRP